MHVLSLYIALTFLTVHRLARHKAQFSFLETYKSIDKFVKVFHQDQFE